jgi:hypothetical protein
MLGNVFGTDIILASLMCCARSVYSWDIIVDRVGDKLFFDKRKMPGEWVHSVGMLCLFVGDVWIVLVVVC